MKVIESTIYLYMQVTIISPFPSGKNIPNVEDIGIENDTLAPMMEELSKSILMGNKSAFQITMESSLKFIPLLFEHYGYLFRNDTRVKDIIFSQERHYDAVVTRSVIGMFTLYIQQM